jgi:hypothetical protein
MIQTFEEKIEMIAQLTAGNKVKFQYVERDVNASVSPLRVSYEIKDYAGKVLDVRDTQERMIDRETFFRRPDVERSRFLVVVQLSDNKIKSFYDGRIINVKKINKSFLRRTLDKLTGK